MDIADITNEMRSDLQANKLNELQKSLFEQRPAEYLFDLKNDNWETNNLADNPAYSDKLTEMRKQLDARILASRDIHFLPEYEIGLLSQTETPYEFRLDDTKYPIAEIYATASLSGKRSREVAETQIQQLKSANKIVRYWAILGLRSQTDADLEPFETEIISAMNDA